MKKEDAQNIAHYADTMTIEELLVAYNEFQNVVHVVKDWMPEKGEKFVDSLHCAIGMSTEAAELLDAHKKELWGKQRPLSIDNMKEESGDMFYYFNRFLNVYGFTLHQILKDNVTKLANRYIDKFDA